VQSVATTQSVIISSRGSWSAGDLTEFGVEGCLLEAAVDRQRNDQPLLRVTQLHKRRHQIATDLHHRCKKTFKNIQKTLTNVNKRKKRDKDKKTSVNVE